MKHLQRSDYIREIFRLVMELQKRNRAVAPWRGLTIGMYHALKEVSLIDGSSIEDLAGRLSLHRSTVARSLSKMQRMKLVTAIPREGNGRAAQHFSITSKGGKYLEDGDTEADQFLTEMCTDFSKSEVNRLAYFWTATGSGLGIINPKRAAKEHPLRAPQRHLTRACGLLSDSLFGGEVSLTQWHTLARLFLAPEGIQIRAWAADLRITEGALAPLLSRMEQSDLVQRDSAAARKSGRSITLTRKGRDVFLTLEHQALLRMTKALESFSLEDLQEYFSLMSRLVYGWTQGSLSSCGMVLPRRIPKGDVRQIFRAFLIRQLVRMKAAESVPEKLLPEDRICMSFSQGEKVHAVFQLDENLERFEVIAWSEELESTIGEKTILASCGAFVEREYGKKLIKYK